MFHKLKNICVFTTKPKLNDLACDRNKWMNPKGDVL